jgi:uncharacterized membrane protein
MEIMKSKKMAIVISFFVFLLLAIIILLLPLETFWQALAIIILPTSIGNNVAKLITGHSVSNILFNSDARN